MKVVISELTVFECGDFAVYRSLQRLFMRAACGQHNVEVSDITVVLTSDFMTRACAASNRVEWEELLRRTTGGDPFESNEGRLFPFVTVKMEGASPVEITPGSVGQWSEQPMIVLLENNRDAVLVRLAHRVSEADRIKTALEYGWLELRGCGGCGEVYNRVKARSPADRLFVLVDSDRAAPGGPVGQTIQGIIDECKTRCVAIHVLERRELENYVPGRVWSDLVSQAKGKNKRHSRRGKTERAILVYRWLERQIERSPEIRSKYGRDAIDAVRRRLRHLTDVSTPQLAREQLSIWAKLSDSERQVDDLKVRFGNAIAECAVERMNSEHFDPVLLDEECRVELGQIAQEIMQWL